MANYNDAMFRRFCAEFRAAAALLAAASVSLAAQEPSGDPWEAAQQAVAQQDWNGALNRLDEARAAHSSESAYWMLYGDATLSFVEQRRAQGERDAGTIDALYRDGADAYRRAAALAPDQYQPWLGVARALRSAGDAAGAWQAAGEAARLAGEPAPPPVLAELGSSGLALAAAAVGAGQAVPEAARQAEQALRAWLAQGDSAAVLPLAELLGLRQLTAEARDVLVTALEQKPADTDWIQRLQSLSAADPAALVADLERVRAAAPGDATLIWYLGDAYHRLQQRARDQGDFLKAYEALDRAEECFLQSMAAQPDYTGSCQAYLHLVRTARGWALREEGRVDDAAQTFAAALEADPQRLEAANDPGTLRLGINAVLDDFFQGGRLAEARALLQRVTAVYDGNGDWMNNYGFACRELGVAAAGRGEQEASAKLFEDSWRAYARAAELSPQDPRILNDRALIAVYYLDHDWDLAETELQRAIRVGGEQLQALPADAPEGQRQRLEEAVGDAWENLAYLDVVRRQRADRAEEYLGQSLKYYPYEARTGVQRLRVSLQKLRDAGAAPGPGNGGC